MMLSLKFRSSKAAKRANLYVAEQMRFSRGALMPTRISKIEDLLLNRSCSTSSSIVSLTENLLLLLSEYEKYGKDITKYFDFKYRLCSLMQAAVVDIDVTTHSHPIEVKMGDLLNDLQLADALEKQAKIVETTSALREEIQVLRKTMKLRQKVNSRLLKQASTPSMDYLIAETDTLLTSGRLILRKLRLFLWDCSDEETGSITFERVRSFTTKLENQLVNLDTVKEMSPAPSLDLISSYLNTQKEIEKKYQPHSVSLEESRENWTTNVAKISFAKDELGSVSSNLLPASRLFLSDIVELLRYWQHANDQLVQTMPLKFVSNQRLLENIKRQEEELSSLEIRDALNTKIKEVKSYLEFVNCRFEEIIKMCRLFHI